jgi:hypothetical protein
MRTYPTNASEVTAHIEKYAAIAAPTVKDVIEYAEGLRDFAEGRIKPELSKDNQQWEGAVSAYENILRMLRKVK